MKKMNPTKIDPMEIHSIKIVETIRRRKSVYKRNKFRNPEL